MTADFVSFEGCVVPMEWGDKVFTVLPIPAKVVNELGKTRRVEGEINDHPVNLALTTAPVFDQVFLWAGKSFLKDIQANVGEVLEVRLRAVSDDVVETPSDVVNALRSAGVSDAWTALTPGKQRGLLHQISTAKRADTRIKRVAKLVADLKPGSG